MDGFGRDQLKRWDQLKTVDGVGFVEAAINGQGDG